MKSRNFFIGAAIGIWLAMAYGGQPGQVTPYPGPVASAPSPSATSAPTVSVPAKPLPERSPVAPAPQARPGNVGSSPGPAVSGGPGWFILAAFSAAIAISVSTVAITALHVRAGNRRGAH